MMHGKDNNMASLHPPTTSPDRSEIALGGAPRQQEWTAAIPTTVFTLLTVAFFAAHQAWVTGFFLPSFGLTEQVLFYGSILSSVVITTIIPVFRVREDRALVLQLMAATLWTVATVWLYMVFPFNFTHFADVVPSSLQFLITWITTDIARTIWAIFIIGSAAFWTLLVIKSAAFIPYFAIQLRGARRRIRETEKT